MARQPCVAQLQSARDTTEQAAALRQIKNEIVGHPLKKELVVSQGVLDPVVRLALRQSHRPDPAAHNHTFAIRPLHEDETIRLQALHILASIAQGMFRPSEVCRKQSNIICRWPFILSSSP